MMAPVDPSGLKIAYDRDGYVTVPRLLWPEEIAALRDEAAAIAAGERGQVLGADTDRPRDRVLDSVLAIHFPHKTSRLMHDTLAHPAIVTILNALIGPDIKAMQSMLFVKRAGKPGQAWHQDEHYIPTRDRSLIGVWIALDDAAIDNGCLWMHPGSHRSGILWPTRPHGDPRFDRSEEAHGFPYEREGGVAVPLEAGGVAFFNGYTLHRSLRNNRESGFGRALVNHYMSARSLLPWSFGSPPTPREDYRDVVIVSGEDPYAWKGLEDIAFPFVRPENKEQAQELGARPASLNG